VQAKEEVDKEIEERTLSVEQLSSTMQDIQKAIERLKQEHSTSENMIRQLVSDEERARTSQLSMLQECCDIMKNDTEAELKVIKQTVDTRVRQRRQGDDELIRRMDEYAQSIEQEHNNREALEASVKKELAEMTQLQKHERDDVNNFIQVSLHALDNQINNRLANMKVSLTQELGESKRVCDGVEKRLSVLIEEMMHVKDHIPPRIDEEALRTSVEKAQRAIEKEVHDRSASEEVLRKQFEYLSGLVEPRRAASELASVSVADRHSVTKKDEQPNPEWQDSDLLRQVRLISMNHLQGNMRIWGRDDNSLRAPRSMSTSLVTNHTTTELHDPLSVTADGRAPSADRFGLATAHNPQTPKKGGYEF